MASRTHHLVLLFASLAVFLACSNSGNTKLPAKRPAEVVTVKVDSVAQKTVPVQKAYIGYVEAFSTVAVKAQIEGTLMRVHFLEGQDVKTSDLLFTIDSRPYEAALKEAEANLARDKIQAENARKEADRAAALFKKGISSEEDQDKAIAAASALDAAVRASAAAIETAKVRLSYCTIYSPLDGRTGTLNIHQGNIVKGNDVLVNIVQTRPIYVAFSIPEQDLPEIRKYMAAGKLKVEAAPSEDTTNPALGELSFVDNTVGFGTILLKGVFPNKDRALWPGQFVDVTLTFTNQPNAIVVPTRAVQTGQQGRYVFVVGSDSKAELRPVVVERVFKGQMIIQKGLVAGEKVVTDGHLRLVPGAMVRVFDGTASQTMPRVSKSGGTK
jgi:multidrug efflux system membrane fusion protein